MNIPDATAADKRLGQNEQPSSLGLHVQPKSDVVQQAEWKMCSLRVCRGRLPSSLRACETSPNLWESRALGGTSTTGTRYNFQTPWHGGQSPRRCFSLYGDAHVRSTRIVAVARKRASTSTDMTTTQSMTETMQTLLKNQLFLLGEANTATQWQDYCGNASSIKYFSNTIWKRYQRGSVMMSTKNHNYSWPYMWMKKMVAKRAHYAPMLNVSRKDSESGIFGLCTHRNAEVDHHAVQANAYLSRRITSTEVTTENPRQKRNLVNRSPRGVRTWKECVEEYCELAGKKPYQHQSRRKHRAWMIISVDLKNSTLHENWHQFVNILF